METMTVVRRNSRAKEYQDAGLDARRSAWPRMIKPARIAFCGLVLDRAMLDDARPGAAFAPPAAPMRHTDTSHGEERQQRCEARSWAVLAVAALHWAEVSVGGLAFIAAGIAVALH